MANSLFQELKRRNVIKVATGYVILGWIVLQVADVIIPALKLPEWTMTLLVVLGGLGFPFVVIIAWAFEMTPEGLKRESEINPTESITSQTGQKINYVIISLLVMALGYYMYDKHLLQEKPPEVAVTQAGEQTNSEAGTSIAVLPFVNMSSDPEQEFFSDGISEEILNVLAKIPNLHVTSRTSAFVFKGANLNLTEVANKLGVKNVLEGSVRKSGDRIRITAQLITAGQDKHLWSETYDRELSTSNLFDIQDEISQAIVNALKTELGLEVSIAKRDASGISLDAFEANKKGYFLVEKRNKESLELALKEFKKATEFSPNYAEAWAGMAQAIIFLSESIYGELPDNLAYEQASNAIQKSLDMAPDNPDIIAIAGLVHMDFNPALSEQYLRRAIKLNPNSSNAYNWLATSPYSNVTVKERIEYYKNSAKLDPLSILAVTNYAQNLVSAGQLAKAKYYLDQATLLGENHTLTERLKGRIALYQGNYAKAAHLIQKALTHNPDELTLKFLGSLVLSAMGLETEAKAMLDNSAFELYGLEYSNNYELFINRAQQEFPRVEDDTLGNYLRGNAELALGNYRKAADYLSRSKWPYCQNCFEYIYALYQAGANDKAQETLDWQLNRYQEFKANNVEHIWLYVADPISIVKMNIDYVQGDIESAIRMLEAAIADGYILPPTIKYHPMYANLRAHSDYSLLLKISDERATEQRKNYLENYAES